MRLPRSVPATALGIVVVLGLTACGAAGTASPPTSKSGHPTPPGSGRLSSAPSSGGSSPSGSPSPTATGPTPPSNVAWRPVPESAALRRATTDRGRITLLWFDPTRLRFRFVPGTRWPEGSPVSASDRVPSTWTSSMVAAFDGGFKLSDHVGGYYYRGRTVAPLRTGLAAFTVTTDGALHVGVWGRDLRMTPSTVVVRENLPPIVLGGAQQARASDGVSAWGITLGHRTAVNRSALGVLPDGGIVFLAGHDVTAREVGTALAGAGVREAMMLDMNVLWPTGYVYRHSGSRVSGTRIASWIARSPSIYYTRFTKDFVVVSPRP